MYPGVEVVALDPDEKALSRARRKARRAGAPIQFVRGFSDTLGYPAGSFDRVFSSFMFHHLGRDEKERTLREVGRVLKEDGRLAPDGFRQSRATGHGSHGRGLHAHRRLVDNDERTILALMTDAGLTAGISDIRAQGAGRVRPDRVLPRRSPAASRRRRAAGLSGLHETPARSHRSAPAAAGSCRSCRRPASALMPAARGECRRDA